MSPSAFGWACVIVSCVGLYAFAKFKLRKRGAPTRPTNRVLALLAIWLPGLASLATLEPAAILIWIGATAVCGWGIAAYLSARTIRSI